MTKLLREFLFIALVGVMIFGSMTQFHDADLVAKIAEGPTEIVLPEPPEQPAPEGTVALRTLDGQELESAIDVLPEGTVLAYVVFFTSDCKYCHLLMQALDTQDVIPVVAIGFAEDDEAAIREVVAEMGITYPVVVGFPYDAMTNWPDFEGFPYLTIVVSDGEAWGLMWSASGVPDMSEYETEQEKIDFLVTVYEDLATQALEALEEAPDA